MLLHMPKTVRYSSPVALVCLAIVALQAGCVTTATCTVPASRVPPMFRAASKAAKVPVDLAMLRQEPPSVRKILAGDMVGVYVYGVVPPQMEAGPEVFQDILRQQEYYPPGGVANTPNMGLPLTVEPDGTLRLPLIDPVTVEGLTPAEAADAIGAAYREREIIEKGRERVFVTLIKPRVHRVVVIREDSPVTTPAWKIQEAD